MQDILRLRRYLNRVIQQTDTGKNVCQDIVRLSRYLQSVIQQTDTGKDVCQDIVRSCVDTFTGSSSKQIRVRTYVKIY